MGIIHPDDLIQGWLTHLSILTTVRPRSRRKKFLITKLPTPPHFKTQKRSQKITNPYNNYLHGNTIDQPLIYHDLFSPSIDTLPTIMLQMSIFSMSFSLTCSTKSPKHPTYSKFLNLKTVGHHPHICPYSRVSDPFLHPLFPRPQVMEKKIFNLKTEFKNCLRQQKKKKKNHNNPLLLFPIWKHH